VLRGFDGRTARADRLPRLCSETAVTPALALRDGSLVPELVEPSRRSGPEMWGPALRARRLTFRR